MKRIPFVFELLTIVALAAAYLTPYEGKELFGAWGFGVATAVFLFLRIWPAFYLTLTFFTMCLYFLFVPPEIVKWPVHCLLVPALISTGIVSQVDRSLLSWIKIGRIDRPLGVWMAAVAAAASIALIFWAKWNGLAGIDRSLFQSTHWILVAGVIVFAILMPLAEESLYRGIMTDTLAKLTGSWKFAAVAQAATYAAFHFSKGFPNGKTGFLLVFIFGLILAAFRKKSAGMLAPYLVHMAADLTIGFYIITA